MYESVYVHIRVAYVMIVAVDDLQDPVSTARRTRDGMQ